MWFNQGDFQRYWYDDDSMNDNWKQSANWVRSNEIDPTDIETDHVQQYSNADVATSRLDLSPGIVGVANCIDESIDNDDFPDDGEKCRKWRVRINTDFDPYDTTERRHILCHEFGHTVGLQHYADDVTTSSCMKEAASTEWNWHDENHVDEHYAP